MLRYILLILYCNVRILIDCIVIEGSLREFYLSPQEEKMKLKHLSCVVLFMISVSALLKLNETNNSPIVKLAWAGKARLTGSHLISPIRLQLIDNICSQLISNLQVTTDFIGTLVSSEVLTKAKSDLGFIRRISFLIHKVENTYIEIINYLENSLLCSNGTLIQLSDVFDDLKTTLDPIWRDLTELDAGKPAKVLTLGYLDQRLKVLRPSPEQHVFLSGVAIGTVGLVAGGIMGSLFGGGDNSEKITTLNDNIQAVDTKVRITNERIDVLSKNLTMGIKKIRLILESMTELNQRTQSTFTIQWNLEQLKQAANNLLILFRVCDNTVTLLRSGHLNADLLNLETFKRVIAEGTNYYNNMEFPVKELTRENIPEIISLIQIQHVEQNKFIMIIPLVVNVEYKAYSLLPHPIKLSTGVIMIAEVNDLILVNENDYITLNSREVNSIQEEIHIIDQVYPSWSHEHDSCEYAGYTGNVEKVLELCNFKKLGNPTGIYLADVPQNKLRLLYVPDSTYIYLQCPGTRIKESVEGLNLIPYECDLTSKEVSWPAKLNQIIDIDELLVNSGKGGAFDIKSLPPFILNETRTLHESIKKQIENLPSEDENFTFDFDSFDVSLEEVTSYSIVASGSIIVIIIIHSVLIAFIYIPKIRNWFRIRREKRISDDSMELGELGTRDRIRKYLPKSPRDSLKLSFRKSFRRARGLSNRSKDSIASSIRSVASSTRDNTRKLRLKGSNWLSPETVIKPTLVNASTNTNRPKRRVYPNLSITSNSSNGGDYNKPPIPAY